MTGKVVIAKDWFKNSKKRSSQKQDRVVHKFEVDEVVRSEDLPEFLTVEDVAKILKAHPKTVRKWIEKRTLQSLKIRGRRRITPQQLAAFLEDEVRKNA